MNEVANPGARHASGASRSYRVPHPGARILAIVARVSLQTHRDRQPGRPTGDRGAIVVGSVQRLGVTLRLKRRMEKPEQLSSNRIAGWRPKLRATMSLEAMACLSNVGFA